MDGTGEVVRTGTTEVQRLSQADIDALGDCVLGHALRRVLGLETSIPRPEPGEPVAVFESSF
jgi:FXSXX-COOH protein